MKKAWTSMLAALILCALVFSGCGQKSAEPDYEADRDTLTMHIGAWVPPPPDKDASGAFKYITEEQYRAIAESGINTIYGLYEDREGAMEALRMAEKVGIEYYVRNETIGALPEDEADLLEQLVQPYRDMAAFAGNLVYDEPGGSKFDMLGVSRAMYDKLLPGKMFYVNLFPTYSSVSQRDGLSYEEYIDSFIEKVHPQVVSYDHYPLIEDAYGETSTTEDLLYNLEVVATKTRAAGIPFWNFVQTMAFGVTNRSPKENDMRWQMAVNMAYGTRGIQHFCYWTPRSGTESFQDAMIAPDGTKTPIYGYAKTANLEVLNWDHVYLNFDWQGTMTVLGSGNKSGKNPAFSQLKEPLKKHKRIKKVVAGQDAIIGTFADKNGYDGFMLVNYTDPAQECSNRVTVTFANASKAVVYVKGQRQVVDLVKGAYSVELEPGEGQFVIPFA